VKSQSFSIQSTLKQALKKSKKTEQTSFGAQWVSTALLLF
jgi:hypothetical protein